MIGYCTELVNNNQIKKIDDDIDTTFMTEELTNKRRDDHSIIHEKKEQSADDKFLLQRGRKSYRQQLKSSEKWVWMEWQRRTGICWKLILKIWKELRENIKRIGYSQLKQQDRPLRYFASRQQGDAVGTTTGRDGYFLKTDKKYRAGPYQVGI